MSTLYRYKCQLENTLVWEWRTEEQGPPTVCVHEGYDFYNATLTILEEPVDFQDVTINSIANFNGATIQNLSHTSLTDIGTHTHDQIDSHVEDATIHHIINDASSSSNVLWSAAQIASQLATKSNVSHTHVSSDITDLNDSVDARISTQKGQNNGIASLDANGKIPASQISVGNGISYQGSWDAQTNTPELVSSVGTSGYFYIVGVAGTTDIDGITDWQLGDWIIFNGTVWEKSDNSDQVVSVAGRQGTIVLSSADITDFTDAVDATTSVTNATNHISNLSNPHNVTLDQITPATSQGDILTHNGSISVVHTLGSEKQVLQVDTAQPSGLSWVNNKKFIVSSRSPYKSLSDIWNRVDHFIFPGSSLTPGNVSRILVNTQAESGITYDIRLYDATQAVDIAKITGQTNNLPAVINLGALSNVPTTDNLFEIHVMRTAGSSLNGIIYYSCMLEYQ